MNDDPILDPYVRPWPDMTVAPRRCDPAISAIAVTLILASLLGMAMVVMWLAGWLPL